MTLKELKPGKAAEILSVGGAGELLPEGTILTPLAAAAFLVHSIGMIVGLT